MLAARGQPQGFIRLNRAHPLFRSLAFAYVAQGNNTFSGYTAAGSPGIADQASIDGGVRTTSKGFGRYSKTGSAYVSRANVPAMVSGQYSLFALGTNATTSGTSQAIDDDDGGNRKFQFRLNNGAVDLITFAGGSPFFATQPTALTLAQQAAGFTMGASVSSTYIASFQNGAKVQTAVSGSNAPTGVFNIGSSKAGGSFWTQGGIALIMGWSRALTDDEQRSLAANPWQLFDGQAPMLYAAAATGISGGITWTEASDSVAASGSATVSGTAAWTEASDSATLAGSVGSSVAIAANWTEAADTAAIAGSAQVTASASWTEQADTLSMAGSVGDSVAGNISWTEANDAATIAASARVNAAGAWAEASDTVAVAANITAAPVVGTIAWTEQADVSAVATYPKFYAFTLMRSDPVSAAGYMQGVSDQFTLMRGNPLYAASAMSDAPLNYTVNLI